MKIDLQYLVQIILPVHSYFPNVIFITACRSHFVTLVKKKKKKSIFSHKCIYQTLWISIIIIQGKTDHNHSSQYLVKFARVIDNVLSGPSATQHKSNFPPAGNSKWNANKMSDSHRHHCSSREKQDESMHKSCFLKSQFILSTRVGFSRPPVLSLIDWKLHICDPGPQNQS